MIVLNECRVTPDGKALIIEASVENMDYYNNVYIDSIVIDTQESFVENGPSNNPAYIEKFALGYSQVGSINGCVRTETSENKCTPLYTSGEDGKKRVRVYIPQNDLDFGSLNNDIFFVYIVANGVPSSITPCGMDNQYTMGVTFNMRGIYNAAMSNIKELDNKCSIPKTFIDYILRIKAFELSLKTGNYVSAIKQWDKLSKNRVVPIKSCGCNGNL